MSYIEFDKVSKIYKMGEVEIKALDEVSFGIDKGEFVVILGASGAGKSTILNILGGMDTATSGSVVVDEKDISNATESELTDYRRFDIGFVFQFYNLVQNLTAKENVELALQISKDPLDALEVLDLVGLKNRVNNFPSQLSGGEQQRVAIARAVACDGEIILADEPTGNLDYETSLGIIKLFRELVETFGKTIIMVTHNNELANMCDHVVHIDQKTKNVL